MHCHNCEEDLHDDAVRWAFEEPYCEDCFDNMFTYCSHCDSVIYRTEAHYNDAGDGFCCDCYEDDYDSGCPCNPDVCDSDRDLIIKLSRNWLQGKIDNRRLISINNKDHHLQTIRTKVGLVDNPIYLFGLIDRDEYQISASGDLYDHVKENVMLNGINAEVMLTQGCNRLGISYSLRRNNQKEIIDLIRSITPNKEPAIIE